MDQKKLYVGNLPWSMTGDTLRDMFASYGEITDAVVISDRMSGRSKGFGFVTFANEADAQKAAAEMNDKDVEGRKLVVNTAKPREDRPDRRDFNRDNRGGY
ncbi:MAG: RNA-binding protein [Microgenomates group bacterium]